MCVRNELLNYLNKARQFLNRARTTAMGKIKCDDVFS